jgi:ABC-type nitrate/sulfonate/bicarbonate transport system substrate-binding protein
MTLECRIDNIFAYNFYQGNFYVRRELEDHAPDVAQALVDAYVEALRAVCKLL